MGPVLQGPPLERARRSYVGGSPAQAAIGVWLRGSAWGSAWGSAGLAFQLAGLDFRIWFGFRFDLAWLLVFIYYDFKLICINFSLISVRFRVDFGLISA